MLQFVNLLSMVILCSSIANPRISFRTLTGTVHEVQGGSVWDLQMVIEAIMNSLMDLKDGGKI